MKKYLIIIFLSLILFTLVSFNYKPTNCIEISTIETNTYSVKKVDNLENTTVDSKYLLRELGMSDDFIKELSINSLEEYKRAKYIYSFSQSFNYPKDDYDTSTNSVIINETYWGEGWAGSSNSSTNDFEDNYMKITYIVAYLGDREYKFSIDAEWLITPFFRYTDSLGAISMNMTVINDSRQGWYSYDLMTKGTTAKNIKESVSSSSMQNVIDGNWYGSACLLKLPESSISTSIYNYKAHYEFNGHYIEDDGTYFNSIASYDHAEVALALSSSLAISDKGGSYGVGLTWSIKHTKRSVEFPTDFKFEL